MAWGVEVFNGSGNPLVRSYASYNGLLVGVETIPASGGPFTYSYPDYAGCSLLAVFEQGAVSVSRGSVALTGSPPSVTVSSNGVAATMYVFVTGGWPSDAGFGIQCLSDYGELLPIHHNGAAATLIAKTTSASPISFATPYSGTWAYGWRYTVTTHEYPPILFVVPPTTSGAGAGLWLDRLAWVSGGVGAKVWEVDIGCYDVAAGGRIGPPLLIAFDRKTLISSGSNWGIQVFNASGKKTFDSNDALPLRIAGTMAYASYFGTTPTNASKYASFPAGLGNPAILISRDTGLRTQTNRFVGSATQYRYSFDCFRKNTDGLLWRTGDGYQYGYVTDPDPAGFNSSSTTHNLPADTLLVIDANEY